MEGQPVNVAPAATAKPQKVSLNPFGHLSEGVKNLTQTNLGSSGTIIAIQFIASMGFGFFITKLALGGISSLNFNSPASGIISYYGKFVLASLVGSLILGFINIALTRTILLGSRRQKTDVGSAFNIAIQRLPISILFLLAVFGILILAGIVTGLIATVLPVLLIVLIPALVIFFLIYVFRLAYVEFLIVEDEKPEGIMQLVRKSTEIWKRSGGALVLYGLTIMLLYIVISALFLNRASQSPTYVSPRNTINYNSSASQEELRTEVIKGIDANGRYSSYNIGAEAISSLVSALISALVLAGVANIYNDARDIIGHSSPTTTTSTGPTPPTPPVEPTTPAAPTPPSS